MDEMNSFLKTTVIDAMVHDKTIEPKECPNWEFRDILMKRGAPFLVVCWDAGITKYPLGPNSGIDIKIDGSRILITCPPVLSQIYGTNFSFDLTSDDVDLTWVYKIIDGYAYKCVKVSGELTINCVEKQGEMLFPTQQINEENIREMFPDE